MTSDHDPSDYLSLLVPEGERCVVFFFPLDDGFGWPPDEPINLIEPLHPGLIQAVTVLTGTEPSATHDPDATMTASLICHEVSDDAAVYSRFTPMLEAFRRGFPYGEEAAEPAVALDSTTMVVEVVVPLITMLAQQTQGDGLVLQELPNLQNPPEQLVGDAFDVAMKSVRELQRSYGAITRRPVKLLARQQLPPVIMYGVRDLHAPSPGQTTVGMLQTNDRFHRLGPPQILTPEHREEMLEASSHARHVLPYLDLYNQADVALNVEGNMRECAVMLGAASEVLLNRLILTLRWEEGITPEDSARDWVDSLITRINRNFPSRLGGNWSLDSGEYPPRRWYRDVYGLRNRVAHAGYEPTYEECAASQRTLNDLISWIGDRLTSGKRLKAFPRTAFLNYPSRLRKRRERLPWFQQLQDDPGEVHWSTISSAWIAVHERLVRDKETKRSPDANGADLVSLWSRERREPTSWILIDASSDLACEATVDTSTVKLQTDRSFTDEIPSEDIRAAIHARIPGDVTGRGPWVEPYHLSPLQNVMVDHSDLRRPWPVNPIVS